MIHEEERILIVDDDRLNMMVLTDILKSDYTLYFAQNGIQALESVLQQLPDLILLNVIMPGMTGFEVMNKLKNHDQTKDIPVIFVSALSGDQNEEKGLLLGAVDYIAKPFNPAIVKARVRNHLKSVRHRKLLEKIALLDGLTEIPNRRSFINRFSFEFKRAIRNSSTLSLAIIDVDCFKKYNDNYGHSMGDLVLKKVAVVIAKTIKRPADFVSRFGGEEFAVLAPETSVQGAKQLAEKICLSIQELGIDHPYSEPLKTLTVSIGGASMIPTPEDEELMLVGEADKMLYKAKNEGRNRVEWQDLLGAID